MGGDARTWRVGIVGLNPIGLFLLEQFRLIPDVRIVGVYDRDPSRSRLADEFDCQVWGDPLQAVSSPETDAVLMIDPVGPESVAMGMQNGKQIVLDRPWNWTAQQLSRLNEMAVQSVTQATFVCLRRWSADFLSASAASKTGRIGMLRSARLVSHEMCIASELTSARFVTQIAFDLLDQLLLLTESNPRNVFAKRLTSPAGPDTTGLLATIEFENGCVAQLDLQTQSRLSLRTGWLLEGVRGSYRDDRLYTVTTDGEVVDEPLSCPMVPDCSFVRELVSSWNGHSSSLPSLADAVRVVQLAEMIERSAETHAVLRC